MNIILADKAGFCFGVKRAVDETLKCRDKSEKTVYTLGPLIHNNDVVNYLKSKDIVPVDLKDVSDLEKGDTIIIRSHGVPLDTINFLKEKKLNIVNTTCPHVANIQHKAKQYYDLGYQIVIVGDKNHPEVIGINGWCNNTAIISKDGTNINYINNKVCLLCQTTEKQENWNKVFNVLKEKQIDTTPFNTICNATSVRQKAAENMAKAVDKVVVLGGKNSSNTTKLFEICSNYCKNTVHVENGSQIPEHIYSNSKDIIGVAAGASTPDWVIKEALFIMNNEKDMMMDYINKNSKGISIGETIKGTVVSVNEKEAYLDLGYKSEGILPLLETTFEENIKMNELYKVGSEVEANVIRIKNEDGYVVLSRIELEREKARECIERAFNDNEIIEVTVKNEVKGGLVSNFDGVRVFIPASHIELSHVGDLSSYIGKQIKVKIIEFVKSKSKIVGSRREILQEEKNKQVEETWNLLEKDSIVEGEVKRFTNFGVFVEINGVDGLLHLSEISWGKVENPRDILKEGQKIKVYILDLDKDTKKLALSIKKLIENPWNNVEEKYPVGNIVLGKVVRFASFGAFVQLEPGIDALVHISKISTNRIEKPEDVLKVGENVKAKILEVNKENKKIALSIKDVDNF